MYYITLTGSTFVCLFSSCHACKADLNSNQLIGDWVRILGEVVRYTVLIVDVCAKRWAFFPVITLLLEHPAGLFQPLQPQRLQCSIHPTVQNAWMEGKKNTSMCKV